MRIFITLLLLLVASVAGAQSTPDGNTPITYEGKQTTRKQLVADIAKQYPQAFKVGAEDVGRRLLIPIIAAVLNTGDNDNWGLLYRLDRQDEDPLPGRLSGDVLVWKPTRDHIDVLSGSGGMWGLVGPLPNNNQWLIRDPKEFKSYTELTPPDPKPPVVVIPPPSLDLVILQQDVLGLKSGLFQLREEGAAIYAAVSKLLETIREQLDDLDGKVVVLESRKIPTGCSVQFGFRCRLVE